MTICPACGHTHAGKSLAYICVGCPCTVRDVPSLAACEPHRCEEAEFYCEVCAEEARAADEAARLAARLAELKAKGWT